MINTETVTKMLEDQKERGTKINYMAEVLRVKWLMVQMEQTQPNLMYILNKSMEAHYV